MVRNDQTVQDSEKPAFSFSFYPFLTKLPPVMDPWYLDRDTAFKEDNIFYLSDLRDETLLRSLHRGSWALARLNFLFETELLSALNTGFEGLEPHVGVQDGGNFIAEGVVYSDQQEIIGHLYLEGWNGYVELNLTECSERFFPDEIINCFSELIWREPHNLKPIHIIIKDPERRGIAFHYGWDGNHFLLTESQ